MRILLINPPQTFHKGSQDFSVGLPVGLLSMAAVLRDEGYSVSILDALITDFEIQKFPGGIIRFGMSWEKMEQRVSELSPDLIGISIPFSAQEENGIKTIRSVKKISPDTPVVAGGPHISVRFREFLKEVPECDIVVRGEGEETLLEIVLYLHNTGLRDLKEIPGISYRKGESCIHNPDRPWIKNLDALPIPAYELLDMEAYLDVNNPYLYANRHGKHKRDAPLITSRGCPFSCIFCSIHLHMGHQWRAHSVDYTLRHLEILVKKYGVEHIHFEDDNLTLKKDRFDAIIDGIIENKLNITWDTPNGVRADTLDRKILFKAQSSGLNLLTIAVESGSQRVLDEIINKKLSLSKVLQVAEDCLSLDIPLRAFFVIGFPGETVAEMEETLKFGLHLKKNYRVNWSFLVATPLFGTKLYEKCVENNYFIKQITPSSLGQGTMENGKFLIQTPDFSPDDIKRIIKKRRVSFLKIKLMRFLKNPLKYLKMIIRHPSYLRP